MIQVTNSMAATHDPATYPEAQNDPPICVCCGVGVDSVAMIIGLHQRGIRPDLITFADTGSEKMATYLYIMVLRQMLRDFDFPDLVVVRYTPPKATYDSLYTNCEQNETLPSLAFGWKSCSQKWKLAPQEQW